MMEWWTASSMAAVVMGLANFPYGRRLTTAGRPPGYWCGSGAWANYSVTACALRITDSGQLRDRFGNDRLKSSRWIYPPLVRPAHCVPVLLSSFWHIPVTALGRVQGPCSHCSPPSARPPAISQPPRWPGRRPRRSRRSCSHHRLRRSRLFRRGSP